MKHFEGPCHRLHVEKAGEIQGREGKSKGNTEVLVNYFGARVATLMIIKEFSRGTF